MNRPVLTIALLLGLASAAYAEDTAAPPDLEAFCAQNGCRTGGFDIAIGIDSKSYTTIPVTRSPYVPDETSVLIFPGETIAVQFKQDGDKLTQPKFLKRFAPEMAAQIAKDGELTANPDDAALPKLKGELARDQLADLPPNTVVISYGQLSPTSGGMMLKTEHNFSRTLKFTAVLEIIRGATYDQHPTSSCAVMPGIFGTEMWPDKLGPLVLTNFRLLAPPDPASKSMTVDCS